jgi:hypothetical protein
MKTKSVGLTIIKLNIDKNLKRIKMGSCFSDSRPAPPLSSVVVPTPPSYPPPLPTNFIVSRTRTRSTAKTGQKNKSETKCRDFFEKIYGRPFPCVRPDFLKNPESNLNLELDMYCESLKIAVEYQGKQHYERVKMYQRHTIDFTKQLRHDAFKKKRCAELGITLFCIPYTLQLTEENIRSFIKNPYDLY